MGRKKTEDAYRETLSIKLTSSQKDVIEKNKWIREEVIKNVRDYINYYLDDSSVRKK